MNLNPLVLVYVAPAALIFIWYLVGRRRREAATIAAREQAQAAGLTEPASLHPLIDPSICIGCGACVAACPEQPEHQVLGLIDGKAQLVGPTDCIGHGACKAACPVGAISLVFGTERRGVDIPVVNPNFETNVPGIFIAGELGGMGLIRNAIEQGRQALEAVRALDGIGAGQGHLDVAIVGAGPAGFAASLGAMEHRLRFVTLEQDTLGGTVANFPRGKLVMTQPARLPLVGPVKFRETSKEKLLAFWRDVERRTGLAIQYQERVETVQPVEQGAGFILRTSRGEYRTRSILLAIGRRGTPRKLNVPGEERSKVTYRLLDAHQYAGQQVLVVGGGDSALEAAIQIAGQPDTSTTIAYRSGAFSRAKPKNRERVGELLEQGRLQVLFDTQVCSIDEKSVSLVVDGQPATLANDAVLICAGGVLPTAFLQQLGVEMQTKYGHS